MLVILSQKVDSKSSYADELFNSYHYPAKYKNQLHKGAFCGAQRQLVRWPTAAERR